MYNFVMENTIKSKVIQVKEKYKYNFILTLIIFILFLVSGYSSDIKEYSIFINNIEVEFNHGIYSKDNEQYIHIDDLINTFEDNIFHDKISGKIIITTCDKLIKISKDDDTQILKIGNDIFVNIKCIMNHIGNNIVISKDKIYISDVKIVDGIVIKNRVEIYDKVDGKVLIHLNKKDKVKIYNDNNFNTQMISVEAVVENKIYYGNSLKDNFSYEFAGNNEQDTINKFIMVKADDKISLNTDTQYVDMVTINMFRLSGVNSLSRLEYTKNISSNIDVIATIDNGQRAANYDSDIVTRMLNSESNRGKVIQQIVSETKNVSGINIDFGNLKVSDKENYTQFIRELSAVMHGNNKKVIVNAVNSQYIDVHAIAKAVDYIVIQPYYARTISSKTSGPISGVNYVEQSIINVLDLGIDGSKIILEIPAYTILWTERQGTVINAEQYNMKAMKAYLKENNIQFKLDNISGQNYIYYTKGITTYKMWLEDIYSITKKIELLNKYKLAGVSIYKSGMEANEIYGIISKVLQK